MLKMPGNSLVANDSIKKPIMRSYSYGDLEA
jgi:hypothetical protein